MIFSKADAYFCLLYAGYVFSALRDPLRSLLRLHRYFAGSGEVKRHFYALFSYILHFLERRLYSQNRKKCGILNHKETLIKGIPELFGKSIGIEEPWYIRSIETKNDEVHVYVDVRDGEKLP
ncbi:MAG: hypothetical protein II871_03135, partial [Clostridia bacterium]|nr:hypothetical protein [Clostridia bacterium]